eukprot:7771570-Ditylum_brightwellii.AAC.1
MELFKTNDVSDTTNLATEPETKEENKKEEVLDPDSIQTKEIESLSEEGSGEHTFSTLETQIAHTSKITCRY